MQTVQLSVIHEDEEHPRAAATVDESLTLSGTVKRGTHRGESVQVQVDMSHQELECIERRLRGDEGGTYCGWSQRHGPHIWLLTLLWAPLAALSSCAAGVGTGAAVWANLVHKWGHRADGALVLVLLGPLLVLLPALVLALYAAWVQLTPSLANWREIRHDREKGFYGWLCETARVPDCCPYEVVLVTRDVT